MLLNGGGGELPGAWGKGLRDSRTLLYAFSGLVFGEFGRLLYFEGYVFVAIPVASLRPRRWFVFDPSDPFDEWVLVRLNSNGLEEFEKLDEAVDAFEGCLFVGDVGAEL